MHRCANAPASVHLYPRPWHRLLCLACAAALGTRTCQHAGSVAQPLTSPAPLLPFRSDVHHLGRVLRQVPEEDYQAMHEQLKKYHNAFVWEVEKGGMAYNYTITSLHNRLRNLLSVHFKRHKAARRALAHQGQDAQHQQPLDTAWLT
jgi:hypothetical protein